MHTANEHETALLSALQMGEADRLSVAAGIPVAELMENAGRAVARAIERRWSARPVAVLCGPGNNGGDGFVVARVLSDAGWPVTLALLGQRRLLTGAARRHADLWRYAIQPMAPAALSGAQLVVDALFGAGLRGPLAGPAAEVLSAARQLELPIAAIDVPSGLNGDTGEDWGAEPAALTVTFFRKKPGHLLLPGRQLCGELVVANIGISPSVFGQVRPDTFENDPRLWMAELPKPGGRVDPARSARALIAAGAPVSASARLSARAAARAGARLTTVAAVGWGPPAHAEALPSILIRQLETPQELDQLLRNGHYDALLLGPDAGPAPQTRGLALALLATGRPTLLDAKASGSFVDDPEQLASAINGPCILTPGEADLKRLFDASGDRLSCARSAAQRSGAVILMTGQDTVIAAPDGRAIIQGTAAAGHAHGDAEHVLGGVILGLLAQGMASFLAAAAGVWLHHAVRSAGAACAAGALADDLPDLLPGALRRLYLAD
jgi:NAD(P)H-hydrate epimerase